LPFCANCGKELAGGASFCSECGSQVEQELVAHGEVNVWAAVVLSVVFPGLGQIYMGEMRRGALFLAAGLIASGTAVIQAGVIVYPVLLRLNAFDVRRSARRISGENGGPVPVSPENGRRRLEGGHPSRVARDEKANSYAIRGHPRMRILTW
jgi:TM2 domain-containing membrane protein YozV